MGMNEWMYCRDQKQVREGREKESTEIIAGEKPPTLGSATVAD
ncbi:MAG: hypothetical protein ACI8RD_010634 [Bacillariaceae sp.]|jgi:hypothetical protein